MVTGIDGKQAGHVIVQGGEELFGANPAQSEPWSDLDTDPNASLQAAARAFPVSTPKLQFAFRGQNASETECEGEDCPPTDGADVIIDARNNVDADDLDIVEIQTTAVSHADIQAAINTINTSNSSNERYNALTKLMDAVDAGVIPTEAIEALIPVIASSLRTGENFSLAERLIAIDALGSIASKAKFIDDKETKDLAPGEINQATKERLLRRLDRIRSGKEDGRIFGDSDSVPLNENDMSAMKSHARRAHSKITFAKGASSAEIVQK